MQNDKNETQRETRQEEASAQAEAQDLNVKIPNYAAQIEVLTDLEHVGSGAILDGEIRVKNVGAKIWYSDPIEHEKGFVTVAMKIYAESSKLVDLDSNRFFLPYDLGPGEGATVKGPIRIPDIDGHYIFVFDAVIEKVAWFEQLGSTPVKMHVQVQRPVFPEVGRFQLPPSHLVRQAAEVLERREPVTSTKKAITIVAFNRPHYLKQVLDALSRCHHIEDYVLCAHIEPNCQEVIDLFRAIDFMPRDFMINEMRLGINVNTYNALTHGFERDDFVIHFEDDTVPAPDALLYFEHCRERFKDDKNVWTVGAQRIRSKDKPTPDEYHRVITAKWFSCGMWGTWRDRWEEMRADWAFDYTKPSDPAWPKGKGWANQVHYLRGDRHEILPAVGRVLNIGKEGGQNKITEEFYQTSVFTKYWAGSLNIGPGEFHKE